MISSAQLSVYPLRQERLGPAIAIVRAALAGCTDWNPRSVR